MIYESHKPIFYLQDNCHGMVRLCGRQDVGPERKTFNGGINLERLLYCSSMFYKTKTCKINTETGN